jgi:phosphate transport system substrate-binding protein
MTHCWTLWTQFKNAAIFAAFFMCAPCIVWADEITLRSQSGETEVSGVFIGFDGQFLQLMSAYGPLTLDYSKMDCEGADCPAKDGYVPTLRVSGASDMAEVLLPALLDAFARSKGYRTATSIQDTTRFTITIIAQDVPFARFIFDATSAEDGFADLVAYNADIVLSTRFVRADEMAQASEAGLGQLDTTAQGRIIGLDALVPVTATGQGLYQMSLQDLIAAFRGEITNWVDIHDIDVPLTLHLGPDDNGQTQGFIDFIKRLSGAETLADTITYHSSAQTLKETISQTPGALGMLPYHDIGYAQPLTLREACGLASVPQLTTLKTEDYPLTTPLFVYIPKRRMPPLLHEVLAFLSSPEAQLVVRRAGFVDQGAIPISLDDQGQRFANAILAAGDETSLEQLQEMVRVLAPRTRMSTSFRFEMGATQLNTQSRAHLSALAQAIRDGAYAGQDLMLIGFSDGQGAAGANRNLSKARATAVRRALIALLGELPDDVSLAVSGLGEALPMACDDTEWGRETNRRVELWVKQSVSQ